MCVRWREEVGERECTESIGGVNWSLVLQYFGRSIAVESPKMKKPTTIRTTSLSLSKARRAWFRMKMIEIVAIVVEAFSSWRNELQLTCQNIVILDSN